MDKKTILGILIGVSATYLFLKMKKKPCGCNGNGDKAVEVVDDMTVTTETEDDLTCEKAVAQVMSTMRFISAEAMEQFRMEELEKCRNS